MRIDAYNKIGQLYGVNSKSSIKKAEKSSDADKVVISSVGRDIQVARKAVAESLDVRADRVAEIKAKIKDGTYNVDSVKFADMLISRLENR